MFNERVRMLFDQEGKAVQDEAVVLKDLTKVCHTINAMYGKNRPRVLLYALICIKQLDAYACYRQPKPRSVEHPISLYYTRPDQMPRRPRPVQTTKTWGSVDVVEESYWINETWNYGKGGGGWWHRGGGVEKHWKDQLQRIASSAEECYTCINY